MVDPLGLGKVSDNGKELIEMVYPDLAQPATKKAGQALETVFEFGNTILLPLKLINTKANLLFNRHMEKYRKKLESIEEEKIAIVPPTLGLKIMDELFTVTNDEIADMFTTLLANASSTDMVEKAHPSFVDVIKNLSVDEAKIINAVYARGKTVKYSIIVKNQANGGVALVDFTRENNIKSMVDITFKENSQFYIDNLVRCGLIYDTTTLQKDDQDGIEELEVRANQFINRMNKDRIVDYTLSPRVGRYVLTFFGERFIQTVTNK